MARNLLNSTFDAATELKDAGALTASAAAQVGGVARVLNVGPGFIDGVMNVDVDVIDITSGDEGYTITLQGSTSSTFASNVYNLASVKVGKASVTGHSVDVTTGRFQMPVINSLDGVTPLPYLRAYITCAGTTPSINCRAWLSLSPM